MNALCFSKQGSHFIELLLHVLHGVRFFLSPIGLVLEETLVGVVSPKFSMKVLLTISMKNTGEIKNGDKVTLMESKGELNH